MDFKQLVEICLQIKPFIFVTLWVQRAIGV